MPDAHVPGKKNPPEMNTADMAMIADPGYLEIAKECQEMTEVDTHAYLVEPRHDAFRNCMQPQVTSIPAKHPMIDRVFVLNLSVPQMTALLGGMRAIGDSEDGIRTARAN